MTSNEDQESLRKRLRIMAEDPKVQEVRPAAHTPKGWEPGVVWEGTGGTITTGSIDSMPEVADDWAPILKERGLDPDKYEVDGTSIKWTSWDGWKRDGPDDPAYSTLCFSFKANIRLRRPAEDDVNLIAMYERAKEGPAVEFGTETGDYTMVINLSDWQIGNADGGGVEAQVIALASLVAKIKGRYEYLTATGLSIGTILLAGLGDLFENCAGFYAYQAFVVQLNKREQEHVIRTALFEIIDTIVDLAPQIMVIAVGGNHGENRGGGNKLFTDKSDNSDVAIFEQLRDMCNANPDRYGHIDWRIPRESMAVSVEASNTFLAFTHGHIAKSRGAAIATVWGWWEKQAMGRHYPGVAAAQILTTGHFHHFNVKEQDGRTVFIGPSLTAVGDYYGDQQGVEPSPGTLTYCVLNGRWSHLEIL